MTIQGRFNVGYVKKFPYIFVSLKNPSITISISQYGVSHWFMMNVFYTMSVEKAVESLTN